MDKSLQRAIIKHFESDYLWFVTFTYRNNVTSVSRVNKDMKALWKQLKFRLHGRRASKYYTSNEEIMFLGSI